MSKNVEKCPSRLWEKMVGNDWENRLIGPNSSKSLPNFPKMSQNVPKCPLQTHRCPNGLVYIEPKSIKVNQIFRHNLSRYLHSTNNKSQSNKFPRGAHESIKWCLSVQLNSKHPTTKQPNTTVNFPQGDHHLPLLLCPSLPLLTAWCRLWVVITIIVIYISFPASDKISFIKKCVLLNSYLHNESFPLFNIYRVYCVPSMGPGYYLSISTIIHQYNDATSLDLLLYL